MWSTKMNWMSRRALLGTSIRSFVVLARQDDFLEPGSMGGQHLLLDAAHWQHPPAQRDLAGHAHFLVDLAAGEGGE
jgi:hypothetical protein